MLCFCFLQPFKNVKFIWKQAVGVLPTTRFFTIVTWSLFSQSECNSLAGFYYKEPSILIVKEEGRKSLGKMGNGQPPGFFCVFSKYEESKLLVVPTKHIGRCHTLMAPRYILWESPVSEASLHLANSKLRLAFTWRDSMNQQLWARD